MSPAESRPTDFQIRDQWMGRFPAYLVMDKKVKVTFDFPPRD
jgi:hypothetical protein